MNVKNVFFLIIVPVLIIIPSCKTKKVSREILQEIKSITNIIPEGLYYDCYKYRRTTPETKTYNYLWFYNNNRIKGFVKYQNTLCSSLKNDTSFLEHFKFDTIYNITNNTVNFDYMGYSNNTKNYFIYKFEGIINGDSIKFKIMVQENINEDKLTKAGFDTYVKCK